MQLQRSYNIQEESKLTDEEIELFAQEPNVVTSGIASDMSPPVDIIAIESVKKSKVFIEHSDMLLTDEDNNTLFGIGHFEPLPDEIDYNQRKLLLFINIEKQTFIFINSDEFIFMSTNGYIHNIIENIMTKMIKFKIVDKSNSFIVSIDIPKGIPVANYPTRHTWHNDSLPIFSILENGKYREIRDDLKQFSINQSMRDRRDYNNMTIHSNYTCIEYLDMEQCLTTTLRVSELDIIRFATCPNPDSNTVVFIENRNKQHSVPVGTARTDRTDGINRELGNVFQESLKGKSRKICRIQFLFIPDEKFQEFETKETKGYVNIITMPHLFDELKANIASMPIMKEFKLSEYMANIDLRVSKGEIGGSNRKSLKKLNRIHKRRKTIKKRRKYKK